MSHFAVLVISSTELNEDSLEPIMAPFHEFECTGIDDQYVVDVDKTAEALEQYRNDTTTMMKHADGRLADAYETQFYREPTEEEQKQHSFGGKMSGSGSGDGISWFSKDWDDGRGYRAKVHFTPDGWTEVSVPVSETMTEVTFVDYCYGSKAVTSEDQIDRDKVHKYGYALADENGKLIRYIDRTNPNAQWDGLDARRSLVGHVRCELRPRKRPRKPRDLH